LGLVPRPLRTREAVGSRIADGLKAERRDAEYAFAVVLKKGSRVIGSTAYLAVVSKHKRAEIGSTWFDLTFKLVVNGTEAAV